MSSPRQFPGFENLFVLGDPGDRRAFRAELVLSSDDAFAATRAELNPPPVAACWVAGDATPSDVIRTTLAAPLLVSDRVLAILDGAGFTGWDTYSVDLRGKDGLALPGYRGLAVRGRSGPIDNTRSTAVQKRLPGGLFPRWRGAYFEESSWDGSDFFVPGERWAWILVTHRVRRALEEAAVRNVHFTHLDEVERMPIELEVPA